MLATVNSLADEPNSMDCFFPHVLYRAAVLLRDKQPLGNPVWIFANKYFIKPNNSTKLYHEFVAVCIVTSAQHE